MISALRLYFHIFWVATFLIIWSAWPTNGMKLQEYFPDLDDDLTKVTWGHRLNSRAELTQALKKPPMMIEADILMGKKEGSEEKVPIPIMAHPPNSTSDLNFNEFLDEIIKAVRKDEKKVGVKLDFKDIESVLPVLKRLKEKKKKINFPVWINADIFANGPVNATKKPLDQTAFLDLAKNFTEYYSVLSVGWTTRFNKDDSNVEGEKKSSVKPILKGKYTTAMFHNAMKTISATGILKAVEVTFPLRAAIAVQSVDEILKLVGEGGPHVSITLWSPVGEKVDLAELNHLLTQVGKHKIYTDLPFSFNPDIDLDRKTKTTSTTESTGVVSVDDNEPDMDSKDDAKPSVSGSSSISKNIISSLLTIALAYCI